MESNQAWIQVKLPEIANLIMGQSPPSDTYNKTGEGLPFFQGKAEFGDLYPTPVKHCSRPLRVALPEDILISVRAPVGPTNLCREESCIGRGLAAIRPAGEIPSRFLLYFLRSIESWLATQGIGSTFTAISRSDLEQIEIPLPPLNEQRRIVAKLEKLLAKVDACQERLAKVPALLKRFRQSVLAAACSGRLTADWRRGKAVSDSPTEALNSENNFLFDLPSSWRLVPLAAIAEIKGGIQKTPARKPIHNKHPYLRVANVYRGYLKLDEMEFFELFEGELEKWRLNPGDILIVEGNGSQKEIGRCAIWNGEIPNCVHQNHIIRCRPLAGVEGRFLLTFLNSTYGIDEMVQLSTSTSGLHTLSVSKVSKIKVPIAPLVEQQEIVRRVEALFKVADQIGARYRKASAYVDKLAQSVLAKAFRGELVPQDPDDEPAAALLERLRRERQQK